MTTETRSLLDEIAQAKRERDAAAVVWCEYQLRPVFTLQEAAMWRNEYRAARSRLAALESKLEQGKDSP